MHRPRRFGGLGCVRWVVACAFGAVPAFPAGADEPIAASLVAAVDQPTPKARAAAAAALASRSDASIETLLDAMRAFAPREPAKAGLAAQNVPLQVGDAVEPTEIHTFVPASYDPAKPAPLLVYLHGAGGDGREAFPLWQPLAERLGMLVLAPTEAGPNEGYRMTVRERSAALAALRWARRRFNVDENRVHVTGVSRGGHLTWELALRWPDRFASAAPMIGGPRLSAGRGENNLRYLENVANLPIRDLQGSRDDPLLLHGLRLAFERLRAFQAKDARLLEFPDRGHDVDFAAVDWAEFLSGAVRDPSPDRVVRRAAEPGEGRAHWIEVTKTAPSVVVAVAPPQPPGWATMSEEKRRIFIADAAERATARLSVRRVAPGRFEAEGTAVLKFRLLLVDGSFDPAKPVTVTWNGRPFSRTVKRNPSVLLHEFVERFDRTFLPVAEVSLP